MKIPNTIKNNLLLKITSLNTLVIGVRLCISLVTQRLLAEHIGEAGIAKVGSLRNLIQLLTAGASGGVFNGVIKYTAELKKDKVGLGKLLSSSFLFVAIGSTLTSCILYWQSEQLSYYLFSSTEQSFLLELLAALIPFIGLQQVFQGVINGLSEYKKYAKIDLTAFVLSALLIVYCLYSHQLNGVLFAIVLTPLIQILSIGFIFTQTLKKHINLPKKLTEFPYAKELLSFTAMSFFSTVLLNFIEIDIRSLIANKVTIQEAGVWTALTTISKNYMTFSGALFTLYVLPKFASISTKTAFKKEILSIYRTLLPLFGLGMLIIFATKGIIIDLIYPNFNSMAPLFKWQLMGDFLKLASIIVAHQFLAKKMVKSFIISELFSLITFYSLCYFFIDTWGAEGIVIAHFLRYILYFLLVLFLTMKFYPQKAKT